ncbi:uncharacterized protein V6R79_012884 [Siganus canaliculatus]
MATMDVTEILRELKELRHENQKSFTDAKASLTRLEESVTDIGHRLVKLEQTTTETEARVSATEDAGQWVLRHLKMEEENNRKYSLHFLMSLRKIAVQLDENMKQTLESIGIIRERSRARGSKAGKNRQQQIITINRHRPNPKPRMKRVSVLSELRFEKAE